MKSRENPRCHIPESQSCDVIGNTRKNTFGDKVTSCLEHMCVIGSTDDMVCVLGKDAFTLVCVLGSYADTRSIRVVRTHTNTHGKKIKSSVRISIPVCVCVCCMHMHVYMYVCMYVSVCVYIYIYEEFLSKKGLGPF